jgi:hypothetical protein
MLDSARFYDRLARCNGDRVRLPIDVAWRAFHQLYPKLSISTDGRSRLAELLNHLANEEKIRLPKGKNGWDSSAKPALPLWMEILRAAAEVEKQRMDEIAWPPELAFAAALKTRTHQEVLLRIREWLAAGGRKANLAPLKERSAEIFGDEKRLDQLLKTELFAPGALALVTLRSYPVYPDLIWEKGNSSAPSILIIENSNTYHSFSSWNEKSRRYAACVYGHGFMIHHTYEGLRQVLQQTNPKASIEYFGDLDATGIRIPIELSRMLERTGLPSVQPAAWYLALVDQFQTVKSKLRKVHPGIWSNNDLQWFSPELRPKVEAIFFQGYRMPQELIGLGWLSASKK